MMYAITLLALLSSDGIDPGNLLLEMEASMKGAEPGMAPFPPMWPEGLPDPILLQDGDRLKIGTTATCYPHPTDFVLDYQLLQWEVYPGRCQRAVNEGWHAAEDIRNMCGEALVEQHEELTAQRPAPEGQWQNWLVGAAVTVAIMLGAGFGYGAARLIHAR